MILSKNVNIEMCSYISMKKKVEKDFDDQILALFDTSPIPQFSKFNNFFLSMLFLRQKSFLKTPQPVLPSFSSASGDRDVKRLYNIEIFYVLFILAFWTMLNFYSLWSSLSKFFPQLCAFRLYTYLTQVTTKKVNWFAFITH